MKILFLDIDGVLNSGAFARRVKPSGTMGIDPETIPHLQRIVDETGCDIVISSTWRILHRLPDIRGMLIDAGMRHPCPVIDKTPRLSTKRHPSDMIEMATIRGDEVKAWVDAKKPDVYVCLDDDSDFHPHQPLVRTDFEEGLTAAHADRCIELLSTSDS